MSRKSVDMLLRHLLTQVRLAFGKVTSPPVTTSSQDCPAQWADSVQQVSATLDSFLESSGLRESTHQSDRNFVGYLEHYRKPETLAMYQRVLDALWRTEGLDTQVRINDYGCWCGAVALLMRNYGCQVVGFDVVDASVQQARALASFSRVDGLRFENTELFHANPEAFEADLSVVMDVLCSANPDEHVRILSSLVRATRPGGVIFISDANNLRDPASVQLLQDRWRGYELGDGGMENPNGSYYLERLAYLRKKFPEFTEQQLARWARTTCYLWGNELEKRVREGEQANAPSVFDAPGLKPPVRAHDGCTFGTLIDPARLASVLRELGCQVSLRRAIEGASVAEADEPAYVDAHYFIVARKP